MYNTREQIKKEDCINQFYVATFSLIFNYFEIDVIKK